VISWTNDGGLPNPDSVNIKGPQGETGQTGPAGPGVPSGGSTGQVLKKTSSTDYDTEWGNVGDVTADMLGSVIEGNSTPVGASAGQYVIVKNSTISGVTDGLYTAAQEIPANTAIDATYLSNKIDMGGLNALIAVSNSNISGVKVVRSNKLVNLQFNTNASGTGWITIASGFPKQIGDSYYFFPAYDATAGVSTMGRLYNGELAFEAAASTGSSHQFRGSTTYFTND
jgi:hypothetical protein